MFAQQGFALLVRLYRHLLPVSDTGSMGVRCVTHHTTEELNTGSSLMVFVNIVRKSKQNSPSSTHFDTFAASMRLYCPVKNVNEQGQTRMRGSSSLTWVGCVGPEKCSVSGWSENSLPVQMDRYVKRLWMAILVETCPLLVAVLLRGILSVPVRGRLLVIKVFFPLA